MSYFLIFLAVMLAAAVAVYVVGLKKPDSGTAIYYDGLGEPVAGLPPVLLPEHPAPADVDKLRFSLGLRGYRMDQVDEALDRLRDEIAAKDARIAVLEASDGVANAEVVGAPAAPDPIEDAERPGPGVAPEASA